MYQTRNILKQNFRKLKQFQLCPCPKPGACSHMVVVDILWDKQITPSFYKPTVFSKQLLLNFLFSFQYHNSQSKQLKLNDKMAKMTTYCLLLNPSINQYFVGLQKPI